MNCSIESALENRDPFDLIWALEACFDVDRRNLEDEPNIGRRVVVTAAMFINVFGASGYAGVIDELRLHLHLVATALEDLGLTELADNIRRINALAEARFLIAQSDEDDWSLFVAENGDFRHETQRDVPLAAALVAQALRRYIQNHPEFFVE
jgi:hypothetical protein